MSNFQFKIDILIGSHSYPELGNNFINEKQEKSIKLTAIEDWTSPSPSYKLREKAEENSIISGLNHSVPSPSDSPSLSSNPLTSHLS